MVSKSVTATKKPSSSPAAKEVKAAEELAAAPKPKAKLRADELKKLRQLLIQERERIIEEMRILDDRSLTASSDENSPQQPGFSLQLADSATDNIQVETDLAIRNIEAEQLSHIDDALRAIDGGNYGICQRCHKPLSFERLKVKPNAKYCVDCLKLLEAGKA